MAIGQLTDPAYQDEAPIPSGRMGDDPETPGSNWPRMLNLDEDTEERLRLFLDEEIRRARTEKDPLVDDWSKWQDDYWAEPAQKVKNFPFKKAANVVIPLTAIAVEAVHARLMNTIFAVEPFWSIRPKSRPWIEAAKPVEEWLQTEVENPSGLDVYSFAQDSLTELIKLGTCIGKSGYEKDVRKSVRPVPGGGEEDVWITRKNGATLDYVPVSNFLMRMAEQDPQTSTWCGEEHSFTWAQMKRMAGSGRIEGEQLDEIKLFHANKDVEEGGHEYQENLDELAQTEPIWSEEFNIQEIWLSFDVDGDGYDEEIVVDFHHRSRTILSIRYNWYEDLHRPYRIAQYVKVEGRWPGIGVGKQNAQFQAAVTTIHRQRLDNATLANMRMIAIKKGSGYGPGEPVFPGKMWFLDDTDDIAPIEMSEVYPSATINEDSLVRYSDKRSGVNEVILGMPQEGTPGTATGDLARIAEGNKRFDLVLKNVRRWFSLLGVDVLANYQQFGNEQKHFLIHDPEEAQWVERVLNMPSDLVRNGAIVELTATESSTNRQVQQQQWLGLSQVLHRYYSQVIQLGQLGLELGVIDGRTFGEVITRALAAADESTKRLLETFDVQDGDRLLFLSNENEGGQRGSTENPLARVAGGPLAEGSGPVRGATGASGLAGLGGRAPGLRDIMSRGNGGG